MAKLPTRVMAAASLANLRRGNRRDLGQMADEQAEWDAAAEYDITGGFDPTNVCAVCWTARSVSGECLCGGT